MIHDFPKERRLRTTPEFQRVFARRCSVADGLLIVYGIRNDSDSSRLGLSVSRKIGNAVVRNRWKRLIREVFRTLHDERFHGYDFIVLPKRGVLPPDFQAVDRSLRSLLARIVRKKDHQDGSDSKKTPSPKK